MTNSSRSWKMCKKNFSPKVLTNASTCVIMEVAACCTVVVVYTLSPPLYYSTHGLSIVFYKKKLFYGVNFFKKTVDRLGRTVVQWKWCAQGRQGTQAGNEGERTTNSTSTARDTQQQQQREEQHTDNEQKTSTAPTTHRYTQLVNTNKHRLRA